MKKLPKVGSDWMRAIRHLEASYAFSGPAALEAMSGIESYILYEEKVMALKAAQAMLAQDPSHERWSLRCECLAAEVKQIEGSLKERVLSFKTRTPAKQRSRAHQGPEIGIE